MIGIKDKRILITGGSSGIGLATVKILLKEGAKLGICCNTYRDNIKKLEGKNCKVFYGDLIEEDFSQSLVKKFIKYYGGIDVLINVAGTISSRNFLELKRIDFDEMYNLHILANYYLMRDAFKYMMGHGGGKIINVSSISVKYGGSENTMHYATSKIGIECMTTRFAKSGTKYNILVNCLRPGFIDTPIHNKLGRTSKDKEERIKLIPLKRAGKPEEIAGMILFLISDYGNFTTGEIIAIAGGD